jgi:Nif-specific regulatory protein
LKSSRGNIRQAAKILETTERIFGYKIKKYDINPKQYK